MPVAQFSGLASGIDSKALIDAIIAARETANTLRKQEIDTRESENDALDELNTKLLKLNDLIDPFRAANGGGLSKKATSSDSTVATAIAGSNSTNSSLSLTVTSVADTATGSLYNTVPYTSGTDVFQAGAGSGSIAIDIGQGSSLQTVTVNITLGTTTVQEVVDAINADANSSGRLAASLINTGTSSAPNYQIALSTLEQGLDEGNLAVTPTGLAAVNVSAIDQATNAVFAINGINGTITRDTNSVSDVISGMTFNLAKAGTANISVNDDVDSTTDKVSQIIEAFNDVVEYINDNDSVERIESGNSVSNVYGSLAKTRVDNDFLSSFRINVAEADSINGTTATSLAELGISTNRDGTLSFDTEEFKAAVGSDPTGAAELLTDFADSTAGVNGTIYQYTRFQGLIDITQDSNTDQVTALNEQIEALNRQLESLRTSLSGQFTRLESIVGGLQSQQQALTGILASL